MLVELFLLLAAQTLLQGYNVKYVMDLSFLCIFKDNNHRSCNIISYEKFNDILLIRIYIYPKFDHKKKWLFTLLLLFLQYYIFILVRCWSLQVWNACKSSTDDSEQPYHELDVLAGHENDVNYVQFRFVKLHIFFSKDFCQVVRIIIFSCAGMQWLCSSSSFFSFWCLKRGCFTKVQECMVGLLSSNLVLPLCYWFIACSLFFIWRLPQR